MNRVSAAEHTTVTSEVPSGNLRYRSPVDARGYTMLMNCVLYDTQLSDGAKITYIVLLDHARQDDACYPGQDKLAAERGLSSRSVRSHLTELEEMGLITIEQRGLNQTNLYWIEDLHEAYISRLPLDERDRKKTSTPDRKETSGQDRKNIATLDRKNSSDKQDAVLTKSSKNKTAARGRDRATALSNEITLFAAADSDLVLRLAEAGLNQADAKRLAASHPEECCRQLGFLPFVTSFKSSKGAYLRSAIEQGFAPPQGWVEAQRIATAAADKQKKQSVVSQAQREVDIKAEQERAVLEAQKQRLQTEQPDLWARIVAEAEAQLPPPLRGKTGHVAYAGSLNGNIERILNQKTDSYLETSYGSL